MITVKRFTLTEEHVKLLRRVRVSWNDCCGGFDAPTVDPKRPYGNSSVCNDIHEILTGESIGRENSERDELTPEEEKRYFKLHNETKIALQVVLTTGSFVLGDYELVGCGKYWLKIVGGY